ncbi:DNA translocase FtsK [Tundrisphaera lichenicola]|uniref:DNA translocase FtsK n=1 Tax=Tundrisphaera lichenicola TaxID=2029860 RepID=UPI003EBF5195
MFDRRRWAGHCRAAALLFAVVFLTFSLVGYDPADSPGQAAEPANDPPANPCGPAGAVLAHVLFASVGWASYLVLYGLAVADLMAFRRRKVADPALRLAGLAAMVLVASALVQKFQPDRQPSPAVGSGGYVGAAAAAFLEGQFGLAGMLLILVALGLIGLILSQEVLIAWPIREAWSLIRPRGHGVASTQGYAGSPGSALMIAESPGFDVPPPRLVPPVHRAIPPRAPSSLGLTSAAPPKVSVPAPMPMGVPAIPLDGQFALPPFELLEQSNSAPVQEHQAKVHARALLLEKTLLEFGCQVRVVQIDTGPVITQFEIELEAGLRVAKINSVANDLAIALAVQSVRIVSPIPNKTTVGIEVPNERRTMVRLSEVIQGVGSHLGKFRIPLFLGKDVKGNPLAFDLADMPHLLIAGRTGTGKSVCLNAMILSILMTRTPDEVKLILIDPKIVELTQFRRIPHLMNPVVTDMKKAEALLAWACDKMDERYGYLARAGVRNIASYNQLGEEELYNRVRPEDDEEWQRLPKSMHSIVIIIDEMGDLVAQVGKEVETQIVRLAQKARAAGIHLILATQKPTVDVITGLIKSNLPARIAFQVTNRNDSRVVLDEMGAEKLLSHGDMLFLVPGTSHLVRAQGTYASDQDVNQVCEYLAQFPQHFSRELTQLQVGGPGKDRSSLKERDELYETAIDVIIREGRGSTSLLQRALGIGYGRAARLIDYMCEDGIVSEHKSGSARDVLYTLEEWEALKSGDAQGEAA